MSRWKARSVMERRLLSTLGCSSPDSVCRGTKVTVFAGTLWKVWIPMKRCLNSSLQDRSLDVYWRPTRCYTRVFHGCFWKGRRRQIGLCSLGIPQHCISWETGCVTPSCPALTLHVLSSPNWGSQLWSRKNKPLKLDGSDDPWVLI